MEKLNHILQHLIEPSLDEYQRLDLLFQARRLLTGDHGYSRLISKEIGPLLHQGLDCNISAVNLLVLEQLRRCSLIEEGVLFLKENLFVLKISKFLLEPEIAASQHAEQILVNLSLFSLGISLLFDKGGLIHFLHQKAISLKKEENLTYLFRLLSVFALIAAQSRETFSLCKESGCLQFLLDQLNLDDVLELLNSLDLVEKLSTKPHGLEYLISSGMANKLLNMVKVEDDEAGGLVADKIIQMFGNIFRQGEDLIQMALKLPILEVLGAKLESQHELVVIATLGALGRTRSGLTLLSQNLPLIKSMSSYLDSSSDSKMVVLGAFSEMFEQRVSRSTDELTLMEIIYNTISEDPPTSLVLMVLVKKPFYDIRKAAYSLIFAISRYDWGTKQIVNTPGFIELLLNRQVETEIEGFTWKFSIIERILENTNCKTLLGLQAYYDSLQYIKCGIIYVPGQSTPIVKEEVW